MNTRDVFDGALSRKIDVRGVYDLPADEYHADPCPLPSLSNTLAKIMLSQSPLHAWTASPRLNPDFQPVERKTFDIGRAAHRAVLGAGADYVAIPDDLLSSDGGIRTKEAKEWVAEARARGITPLKQDECDRIDAMKAKLDARLSDMGITFDPARSEKVAIAQIDGVWCRAMMDNVPLDARLPIYDLKTTVDASLDAVTRTICNYGYDVQAAHYLQVWKAATGEDRRFQFVFTEKEPPHEICVVELYNDGTLRPASDYEPDEPFSGDWFGDAAQKLARARRMWRACLDAGDWPGYPARVALVGAPVWHRRANAVAQEYDPILPDKPSAEVLALSSQFQKPEGMI